MNVKFLNPFVDAAFEVLKKETGADIQRGELALDKNHYVSDDVTVIIALVGAVVGNVFYSMSQETAIHLASRMMSEKLLEFDSLAQSGIAELGNVITGRASMKLSEAGFDATISPPSLILGKGATISTLDFPRIIVPLNTSAGNFMIHLALRQGVRTGLKTSQLQIPPSP
ncbi:MAG: chemotaxis protein CheX [Anaerolineaceae bacterium]